MRCPALLCLLAALPPILGATQLAAAPAPESTVRPARLVVGPSLPIETSLAGMPMVEPHVSAHPSKDGHLLVAAMIVTDIDRPYESCRLSSFVSSDGGIRWAETEHDWWGYDPWTAILPDGRAMLTWLGTKGAFRDRFPVRFLASPDAGSSWLDDVQSVPGNHDGTKVVGLGETFAFTTVRFTAEHGADVVLHTSRNGGRFEEVARIPGEGRRLNFCEPAILPDGRIVVPASEFLERIWVQVYDPATGELSGEHPVSGRAGGAGGYLRLAADVGPDSPFRGRLHFVRALGSGRNHEGVWINTSADGGRTWSPDRRVDRFPDPSETRAVLASVAVNPQGIVAVSWVDRQADPERRRRDVYVTASTDGGETFLPPSRVSSVSTDPRTEGNGDVANKFPGGGHYMGLAARAGGGFQLVWSDSRTGLFRLRTAEVRVETAERT